MSGGLSEVPTVPQGIRSVWWYGPCGADGCHMMPHTAQPQHPPPQHPPPFIEDVLTDSQQTTHVGAVPSSDGSTWDAA
eukprot:7810561-Prorocentrum_lima.AAC.1